MKSSYDGVAAVAEVGDILKGEHLSVRRAVGAMARQATLDSAGAVFEHKRSILVGMTVGAERLFEPTEKTSLRWHMGVVTGRAVQDALLEAVTLVEFELRKNIRVTAAAGSGHPSSLGGILEVLPRLELGKERVWIVNRVTADATQPDSCVGARIESAVIGEMTGLAPGGNYVWRSVFIEAEYGLNATTL